jgi:hypothetical protein
MSIVEEFGNENFIINSELLSFHKPLPLLKGLNTRRKIIIE